MNPLLDFLFWPWRYVEKTWRQNKLLAVLLASFIAVVLLVLAVAKDSVGTWLRTQWWPAMAKWIIAVYEWPLSPIILALILFLIATVIVGFITRKRTLIEYVESQCTQGHITLEQNQLIVLTNS